MDLSKKNLCPRLVDYVVIAGNRKPYASQNISRPQMLRRYPVDDHKDFPLPFEIAYFCQPEGNFTFRPKTSSDIRRTSSFTFSLTDKDSAKIRHGICFNFFRPARRPTARRRENSIGADSSRFTLTSICILTHHPFLSTFRDCLNILYTLIDSCDLRASSLGYRGQIWELLAGQIAIDNIHPAVLNEVREVETWILRFLCCPVPVPGKTLVEVELLPLNGAPVARFGFPDRTRFPLVDYPLHLPFELLGVDTALRVLTCILLENKVLLRSKDVNAVSMTVMAFVAMLYPLEYMFPVIPLLPACLPGAEQLLLAPTPYIIGIPESFLILRGTTIPDDVWLVDLDANKMYGPSSGEDIPPLPEMEGSTLRSHIEQAIRVMNSDQDSGLNLEEGQPGQKVPAVQEGGYGYGYGSETAAVDVATRMAINRFLNSPSVLGNLTEHIRTLRLYPRPVIAFQVYSFLRSRPTRTHFIDRFAKTQAVEFFAEWSLSPNNVAFLRANTGISDPKVIGDKLKWFAEQLQPVYYQVFDSASAIGEAVAYALSNEHLLHFTSSFSNGGEDSDDGEYGGEVGEEHSYGVDYSRADFDESRDTERLVYHMVCPDLEREGQYQWRPPDQLQLPGHLLSQSSSTQSIADRDMDSDDGASSRCSSPDNDTASRSTGEALSTSTGSTSERGRNSAQAVAIMPTPKTPASKSSLINFRFGSIGSEGSNALSDILGDKTTEQVAKLQNTMTDLADKSKQNFQKATSLFKSLQQQSKDNILESTLPLKISITGSDAHNQSAKFVNDLTSKLKKVGNSVEKTVADTARPQPFGPFPSGRRNPNERNSLIRHDSTQSPPESRANFRSAFEQRSGEGGLSSKRGSGHHSIAAGLNLENQHFVKEMIDCVMAGDSISWLKMKRLKKLLEDENYRNFLIARLNFNIGKQLSDDHYLSDVMIGNEQWKGYCKLLQLCVAGLDKSFQSWGLGGMGSTFHILEVAYTHYTDMKAQRTHSAASGFMNMFQPRSTTPSVASENGRNMKPSDSLAISSDQLASGFRSVMNNVRTLASNNATSILISEPTLDMSEQPPQMVPLRPEPSVTLPTPDDDRSPPTSSPSSPDTEGPDSPSASRRSSQSDAAHSATVLSDVNRKLTAEGHQQADEMRSHFLDPAERSPFASPSSSRRSSRSTDDGSNSGSARPRRKLISHQSITSFNTTTNLSTHGPISEHDTASHGGGESYSRKSSISSEYRYRNGQLFAASSMGGATPGGASTTTEEVHRVYLFESLLGKSRGKVFDQMQFWDDAFIDAVALERDLIGMDQGPSELLERYKSLAETDKKRMEHDEDRLLATMLHNLVAYMVSMQVRKVDLRKTVRRLLGKSHLGMAYSSEIHKLLEQLDMLNGNEIDLKPPISRQRQKQTFTVQMGTDSSGDIAFMEVRDDGLVVRSIDGLAADRIYYDNLINMTFSPKTKVLCLWHRQDKTELEDSAASGPSNGLVPITAPTKLNQYYCKKSKELYHCIKESMERAASRGKQPMPGADLGGDFPIQDMRTGEGGLLQVTMDGVGLLFANSKYFMQLSHIRKCFTQKGGIFVLEEYNPDTQQVTQRKYKSPMSDQICYSVLCLFSYIAAASTAGRESAISTPPNRPS
ncbi:hypothetical protein RvY_11076 [Ramazzottius varieornatus]|uniref:MAP kinase-activating death domain protein n=1 Tax=Ramazzottius varieornatus TaxID=947166 RepID=A0A1D1VEY8_RAMVA|nr:hypothetical protein RvY_11076 [Ramazzottius varieornatus]